MPERHQQCRQRVQSMMAASIRPAVAEGRCAETENIVDLVAATRTAAIHYSFSLCSHLAATLRLYGAEKEVAALHQRKNCR
jgi:hypothetical protein